jgi:hypothetical protein
MSVTVETPNTSAAPSILEDEPLTATNEKITISSLSRISTLSTAVPVTVPTPTTATTYPPPTPRNREDTLSISSLTSTTSSRKARPESLLVVAPKGPLVLGIALVDFNHLVCHFHHRHHIKVSTCVAGRLDLKLSGQKERYSMTKR